MCVSVCVKCGVYDMCVCIMSVCGRVCLCVCGVCGVCLVCMRYVVCMGAQSVCLYMCRQGREERVIFKSKISQVPL